MKKKIKDLLLEILFFIAPDMKKSYYRKKIYEAIKIMENYEKYYMCEVLYDVGIYTEKAYRYIDFSKPSFYDYIRKYRVDMIGYMNTDKIMWLGFSGPILSTDYEKKISTKIEYLTYLASRLK